MERTFARHGLNGATFDVLATLRCSGSPYALSPGDLMATMMVTSGTLTNRIDQLEQAGFVSRRQGLDDKRSVLVALTHSGRNPVDVVVADHVATQRRLVDLLDLGDRKRLGSILRRYLEVIAGHGEG
ncbi:MarR family winged helix-turn-helix transcriptional regulator [Bosea sp. (in: a-proteobacteria)]|jgi:DNA-binding MarR family transcriptional regulator|uniref:MarR family winged helix-turn-helix transcriptional regulator n=1 Tax=Bosea sp. (in: a-proteobacteria) TaxID=1871050 RepID=UPI003561B5CA